MAFAFSGIGNLAAAFALLLANAATGCAAPRFAEAEPAFQRDAALCEEEEACRSLWEQAVAREKACRASGGDELACSVPTRDREILAAKVTTRLRARIARQEALEEERLATEARERLRAEKKNREREAQRLRDEEQDAAANREEAEDWRKVDIGACVYAPSVENCNPLLEYSKKYEQRGSVHLDEANRTIAQVRAPLIAALDRQMWEASRAAACAAADVPEECDGVVAYLKVFPNGARAADAKKALHKGLARLVAGQRRLTTAVTRTAAKRTTPAAPESPPPPAPLWEAAEPSTTAWQGGGSTTGTSAGGPVQVRAYTKKDGTHVEAHTRAAPRR